MKKFLIALLGCALGLATLQLNAATFEGQTYEDSVRIANRDLVLNGMGLRGVLFIKGYVAGLYLREKSASVQDVVAMSGPKRLQLRMLRTASPNDFNAALTSGIRKNATDADVARLSERIAQLESIINSIGGAANGDVINFDYVPDMGTAIAVNGVRKGPVIAGADFYNAVLSIFVGEFPVDEKLKRGLLGQ